MKNEFIVKDDVMVAFRDPDGILHPILITEEEFKDVMIYCDSLNIPYKLKGDDR